MTIATFDMNARRSAGSKSIASATAWSNSCSWSSSRTAASLAAHVAYQLRGRCSWLRGRRARPPVSLRCCDGEGLREAEEVTEEAAAEDTQGTPLREAGGEEVRLRLAVFSANAEARDPWPRAVYWLQWQPSDSSDTRLLIADGWRCKRLRPAQASRA